MNLKMLIGKYRKFIFAAIVIKVIEIAVILAILQGCTSKTGLNVKELQHSFPNAKANNQVGTSVTPGISLQSPEPGKSISAKIFFANSNKDPDVLKPEVTYPVEIPIKTGNKEETIRAIVEELIKGPPDSYKREGYYTTLPPETAVNSIREEDDTIKVDFNDRINEGGGSCTMDQRRSQIENTLMNVPQYSVKKVIISVNGDTQNVLQP